MSTRSSVDPCLDHRRHLIVERAKARVPVPTTSAHRLGHRILVTIEDPAQALLGFTIAARIAAPDSGVVWGILASSPTDARTRAALLAQRSAAGFTAGVDTEPRLMVHRALAEGVLHAALAEQAQRPVIGADCGGHIFSRPDGEDHVFVRLGAIDGDPGIRPSYRQWVSSAVPWEVIPDDGLPRFDGPGQ